MNAINRCVHHYFSKWNRSLNDGHSYFISFKYHTYGVLKYILLKNYCNPHLQLITSTFCLQHAHSVKQQTACHVETQTATFDEQTLVKIDSGKCFTVDCTLSFSGVNKALGSQQMKRWYAVKLKTIHNRGNLTGMTEFSTHSLSDHCDKTKQKKMHPTT